MMHSYDNIEFGVHKNMEIFEAIPFFTYCKDFKNPLEKRSLLFPDPYALD
jgi:hypothetical protein